MATVHCDQCDIVVINGVACHEHGCPNAPRECPECGCIFEPETTRQRFCDENCANAYNGT